MEHESDQSRYASECDLCETDGSLHMYNCPNNPRNQKMNNESELTLLGKAYYAISKKDEGDQDARGWNKALKAIWEEYERLANGN